MRDEIVLVRDGASQQNTASLETYRKALNLWRIPYRVVEGPDLNGTDLGHEIDRLVYDLYGPTEEEIEIVEKGSV